MRVIPLAEVLQMSAGEQVTCTKGKVKTMLDYHKGQKDDGTEWSMQKIILTDGKSEVAAKLWDREALPKEWKGKEVYISCTLGQNNRWNGVKTKEDTYQGKTAILLNVTAAGRVDVSAPEEVGAAAPTAAPAAPAAAPAPAPAPAAPAPAPAAPAPAPAPAAPTPAPNHAPTRTAPTQPTEGERLRKIDSDVARRCQLMLLVRVKLTEAYNRLEEQTGIKVSAEELSANISSVFISCDKDRLHYDLPDRPLDFARHKPTTAAK